MTVPATILELLQKNENVSYSLAEVASANERLSLVPNTEPSCLVRGLVLRDSNDQFVHALVPANTILDLDAMFRHFDIQFEGAPQKAVWSLIESKSLKSVPAIPSWAGMKTYVDDALFLKDILLLDSGDNESLIELNNADFSELTKHCERGNFSSVAPEQSLDDSTDESEITQSIQRFTERRIKQRLDETLELPPLPETAQRIIKLRADPNADISDLTNIVEIDPSLAAQVVSWASSPYYSAPGKIKSVHDAIVRVLGFDMVLNLALGLALGKTLSMKALSKEDIEGYWQNSVYTAAAVEGLVTSIAREHRPSFGMAYLSGLLNNFGYLILAEIFPPYLQLISRAKTANAHIAPSTVEAHSLGISGNQMASWLLQNWNMPEEVVTALRFQNNLDFSGEHEVYAKLNFVAKQMLANQGFGNILPAKIPDNLFEDLHLDKKMAETTVENILESADDLDSIAEKMRG